MDYSLLMAIRKFDDRKESETLKNKITEGILSNSGLRINESFNG
jgi:hypothetical protein